eukprot:1976641-Alexandrium_andersonii.AAC.1
MCIRDSHWPALHPKVAPMGRSAARPQAPHHHICRLRPCKSLPVSGFAADLPEPPLGTQLPVGKSCAGLR